jgi:hypothetical protein
VKFWCETYSGVRMPVPVLDPAKVNVDDIGVALARQCRFNGHCEEFYSVAEHSVNVVRILLGKGLSERVQLLGLLHDAHEAYLGDIIRPVKCALEETGVRLRACELAASNAVLEGLGVSPPDGLEWAEVNAADNAALATEAEALMESRGEGWGLTWPPAAAAVIACLPPDAAAEAWWAEWERLGDSAHGDDWPGVA